MTPPVKLTKRSIDAAPARAQEWLLSDAQLPGFGVRIYPTGKKVYCYRYRTNDGARRRINLGAHGPLTVEMARSKALEAAARVANGEDPAAEKREARQAPRVSELIERFLEEHVERRLKPGTAAEYRRICRRYILPGLGTLRVRDVTPSEIATALRKLTAGPIMANRIHAVLSSAFSFAAQPSVGMLGSGANPVHSVPKNRERRRTRAFTTQELLRIFEGIDHVEKQGANPGAVAALKLSLLLGWRISECLSLRWTDIDFDSKSAILRDAKAGTRTARLSDAACELLHTAPRLGPVLAPGRSASDPVDYKVAHRIWKRACEQAGVENAQIHDCRRSMATRLANDNASAAVIQAVLGHTTPNMALRYVADARLAAASAIESYGALLSDLRKSDHAEETR